MKKLIIVRLVLSATIVLVLIFCIWGGVKFNTPTVNLFIPAEDYIKFVSNLEYYLSCEIRELNTFTDSQREKIRFHIKREPEEAGFPFGIIDNDIIICFMHYSNYEEAEKAWNRRKSRVRYDHLGILLVLRGEDVRYAYELDNLSLPFKCKRTVMSMNNKIDGLKNAENVVVPDIPEGVHWMSYRGIAKKYYEKNFDIINYINCL